MNSSLWQILKGPLARQLTLSLTLLAITAVVMAVVSVWAVQFTDNTLSQVTNRMDKALLSAQIRSESLVLTDLVRRYTILYPSDAGLRDEIANQQAQLDELLQAAIDSTIPSDTDESIAIGFVRQNLIAFDAQASRVLQAHDAEGELGPTTTSEFNVLVENYQPTLLQAIKDFETYEIERVQAARQQTRQVVQTIVIVLVTVTLGVLLMTLFMSRHNFDSVVVPLANLYTGLQAIRQGDLTGQVAIKRNDEIGRLAEALNTMSAELLDYRQRMKELVEARTAQLAAANQNLSAEIAERKQAEQALRRSEENFRKIFEANPFPILISRRDDGHIIIANQAMSDYLEVPLADLVSKQTLQFYTNTADREIVLSQLQTHGQVVNHTLKMTSQTGRHKVALLNLLPIEHNDAPMLLAGLADITNRVETEEALQEAKEAAESANRAKSMFLASMSHELRTPLNGVLGYTQILKYEAGLSAEQLDHLERIERSGEHLLTLINDILDLSKVEAGKEKLQPINFNLQAMLEDIVTMLKLRAESHDLYFLYEVVPFVPPGDKTTEQPAVAKIPSVVYADAKRLRQILINLLGNAIKFTQQGGVTLSVGVGASQSKEKDAQTYVPLRFKVSDTGIGIKKADLAHIFEPFQQVGNMQVHPGGTGLGLAITKKLLALMNSQLHVESTPGQGTTFWFELLLPLATEWIDTPAEQPEITGQVVGPPLTLLLVDDKAVNLGVLRGLLKPLQPLGLTILEANEAETALALARKHLPDCIITDLVMPGIQGADFVRRLRKEEQFKDTPIIVSSASVFNTDKQASLVAGADVFLPKPVQAGQLYVLLQELLPFEFVAETAAAAPVDKEESLPRITPPPQPIVRRLLQAAFIGDIGELHDQVESLKLGPEKYLLFTTQLEKLVSDFEMVAIVEWMETLLPETLDEAHDDV